MDTGGPTAFPGPTPGPRRAVRLTRSPLHSLKKYLGDFRGGPAVKTLCIDCREQAFSGS